LRDGEAAPGCEVTVIIVPVLRVCRASRFSLNTAWFELVKAILALSAQPGDAGRLLLPMHDFDLHMR